MSKSEKYFSLELCLIITIAIAAILRVINLSSREFWYDEVLSLLLSTGQKKLYTHPSDVPIILSNYKSLLSIPLENSLADMLQTFEKLLKGLVAEPHPPLFFIGQHFWLRLFGNSVTAMRSLPVIYSLGAIFCSYRLGRKLLGYRGGLLLAATLSVNPFFFFHSLNVRMYCSLVFWVVLSGWATVELVALRNKQVDSKLNNWHAFSSEKDKSQNKTKRNQIFWSLILLLSATAGLMTFYYFCFWMASLVICVLALDFIQAKKTLENPSQNILAIFIKLKGWQQQSLLLAGSVIITIPWLLWGTRQQFNNADLGRFKAGSNLLETTGKHLAGILTTLGVNLFTGDWATILSPTLVNFVGLLAIAVILASISYLWRNQDYQLLSIAISFSLVPLLLMVAVDVISGKFTVGFGFGRSLILILPGCLLLLVSAISKMKSKWQIYTAIALLVCYFSTTTADYALRQRSMFHDLADIITQQPNTPTLIIMNSNAWGHVLRLAYYLPEESPIELLAQPSRKLNTALVKTLETYPNDYQRLILLDSDRPVWGATTTPSEEEAIQQTLAKRFKLIAEKKLVGTWELDNFEVSIYQK